MSAKLIRVPLHPDTIKYIRKGHPWVTLDRFSKEFPKKDLMVLGTGKAGEPVALLLNDPKHKNIKARVWSLKQPFNEQVHLFKTTLFERLEKAFNKRTKMNLLEERQNFFLFLTIWIEYFQVQL